MYAYPPMSPRPGASGRGADIPKYMNYNIDNVIMVEIDEIALQEAITERKYSHLRNFNNKGDYKKKFLIYMDLIAI